MTPEHIATLHLTDGTPVPDDVITTFNLCLDRAFECASQSNRAHISWDVLKTVAYIATTDRDERWALITGARARMNEAKVDGRLRLSRP